MRDDHHEECQLVTIGNGCKGISAYYEGKEDKDRLHVPWKDIVKISYKRDKFRIIYHPPEVRSDTQGHVQPAVHALCMTLNPIPCSV